MHSLRRRRLIDVEEARALLHDEGAWRLLVQRSAQAQARRWPVFRLYRSVTDEEMEGLVQEGRRRQQAHDALSPTPSATAAVRKPRPPGKLGTHGSSPRGKEDLLRRATVTDHALSPRGNGSLRRLPSSSTLSGASVRSGGVRRAPSLLALHLLPPP